MDASLERIEDLDLSCTGTALKIDPDNDEKIIIHLSAQIKPPLRCSKTILNQLNIFQRMSNSKYKRYFAINFNAYLRIGHFIELFGQIRCEHIPTIH